MTEIEQYPHRNPGLLGVAPSHRNTVGGRYWRWQWHGMHGWGASRTNADGTIQRDADGLPVNVGVSGITIVYTRPNGARIHAGLKLDERRAPTPEEHKELQDEADKAYDEYRIKNGLPL